MVKTRKVKAILSPSEPSPLSVGMARCTVCRLEFKVDGPPKCPRCKSTALAMGREVVVK